MAVQFQVRRGTATEWAATPVTLALGEFGFDTTNKLLKIGDGSLTFSALPDLRATGVIPSGGTDGQGLIKNGTALAWADYVSYPTGTPVAGAALVRNSSNTGNIWASGAGLGTLTGLVSTSPLTIGGTVGGSYTSGSATIGLDASALNTFLSNLSGTVAYANTATTLNLGTSATTLNLGTISGSGGVTLNLGYLTSFGTTSTVNINTAAANGYSATSSYTARITNISTGLLYNGADGNSEVTYALTNAEVNIGNNKANSAANGFIHTTNIYGNLKLPQWVSGALVTDSTGLVGKQTVASTNTNGAIVARDGSGNFSAGTISAAAVSVTGTVSATTLTGAYDAASLTGFLNIARIAATTITGGGSSGKIASGTITDYNISGSAAIADTKLGTISAAGKVANSATTATSNNTASYIVARDGSGNFSAGAITATSFNGSGVGLTSRTVPISSINTSSAAPLVADNETVVSAGTSNLIVIDTVNSTIDLSAVALDGWTITIVRRTTGDVYSTSNNIISRTGGAASSTICSGAGSWVTLVYRASAFGALPAAHWYVMAAGS